jgi:hypothetical protein
VAHGVNRRQDRHEDRRDDRDDRVTTEGPAVAEAPPSRFRRLIDAVRFPPPYEGPIIGGRIDGVAYLVGWTATLVHILLWVPVVILGFNAPWPVISTLASVAGGLLFITIVLVIHRRMGEARKLPIAVVWQWWLGPWDPVGRLVWLPVRLPEAGRALVHGVAGVEGDVNADDAGVDGVGQPHGG